jgi:phosphoribosylformylglycinamidine synthase
MLKGMEDSILGVWVAHGEGRCHFPDPGILQQVTEQGLAPIRFVNSKGEPTEQYPFNPNCSVSGITALCSPDGRHLALMPHPERCFLRWQWPYWPKEWKTDVSPWLQLFQNAYRWCKQN